MESCGRFLVVVGIRSFVRSLVSFSLGERFFHWRGYSLERCAVAVGFWW